MFGKTDTHGNMIVRRLILIYTEKSVSVSFRKTTVFLAEIGQGDRKTYLECMAEGEAEDLVGKKRRYLHLLCLLLPVFARLYICCHDRLLTLKF